MAVMIKEAIAPPKTVNPFWDEVREVVEDRGLAYDAYAKRHGDGWTLRDLFCRRYSWAIPDPASLAFVAKHLGEKAIEIGAGTGYWAWQLSQMGVDILAYDMAPPDKEPNGYFVPPYSNMRSKRAENFTRTWYPVKKRGPEVLKKHSDRTLFLCWPPNLHPMSDQCLKFYRGNRLVFVGDSSCCGSLDFADLLDKDWDIVETHEIARWRGINDSIVVYERAESEAI